jgi:hypothetical protein
MDENKIARLPAAVEPAWEESDVVLDANADIWQRACPDDVAQGWPWHLGVDSAWDFRYDIGASGEGGHREDDPVRPLTLLVRRGKAVQTIVMKSG